MNLQNMLRSPAGWLEAAGNVIISSRIRLARNLSGVPFPHQAGPKTLAETYRRVVDAARQAGAFKSAAVIKLSDVEPVDRAFLVERHLISRPLASKPDSRGVVVGPAERLSLMVNEEDHLRLQAMGPALGLVPLWESLNGLDDELGGKLPFAYDGRLGYLTAHPSNLGPGMRASCLAHLPGLTLSGDINQVLEALPKLGMTARGAFGEGTRVLGDLYQISNATSLGRGEAELAAAVEKIARQVEKAERAARERLFRGPARLQTEDRVWRSLGVLTHARRLSYEEAAGHLSNVRMGLAAGLDLKPANVKSVDELFFLARPAHLQMLAKRELDPAERDALRAEHIRSKLK